MTDDYEMIQLRSIKDLRCGDIIRNKGSANAYVVTAVYGSTAVAVDTIQVSNAPEWLVLRWKYPRNAKLEEG